MSRRMLVGVVLVLAPPLAQQSSLRVLHVTPASAILPTQTVTVTFDRAVVGPSGRVIDPERIASLQPAVPVRFDWRDPSTLRLVPVEPWTPGQVVILTIDTTLVALDGSRLTSAVRIPIRVKGPARRASVPELSTTRAARLPPDGRLQLLYSSEVDSISLASLRYEFISSQACRGQRVALRVESQRPLTWNDTWQFNRAAGADTMIRRMARVVNLVPASKVPDGCDGSVVVPSLDTLDAVEISYPISSAVPFGYASLMCASHRDCAASASVTLTLTAPIGIKDARTAIRVDGAPPSFILQPGPVLSDLTFRLDLTPGRVHRVTIDSTLTDIAGRRLNGTRQISLEVGDRKPRITHPAGFITLPRQAVPFIRVSHVNVDSAQLELLPLPLSNLDAMFGAVPPARWREPEVVRRMVALGGPRNEIRATTVPLPELGTTARLVAVRLRLQRGTPGLRSSVMRFDEGHYTITSADTMTTAPAIVQMTNLAVHARLDEQRGAVLITDLQRGLAVRGAIVTLRANGGSVVATSRTDSSGVAIIGGPTTAWDAGSTSGSAGSRSPRLVEVEHRGDRALLPVALDYRNAFDRDGAGQNYLSQWYGPGRGQRAFIFTDRDLYRPGERVYLAGMARDGDLDRLRVPEPSERFRWRVQSYGGGGGPRVVHERTAQVTRFGTSVDSFDLAPGSSLGYHDVELQRERRGQWVTATRTMFQVMEYRAPEFTVSLTTDSARHFTRDTLRFGVSGRYLYDAPMRAATVRWNANIADAMPWDLRIPSLPPGFHFGDPATSWENRPPRARWQSLNGTDTLDASGRVEIRVQPSDSLQGTKQLSFSVSVGDVNRQVVTSTSNAILYGSTHYLAVRESSRGWWRVGTPVRVGVLAVRPNGSRAAGAAITARIVYSRWVDSSGIGARGRWVPDTIATSSLVSADTAVSLSFTPRAGGYYTVQLFGRDSAGREVESRLRRFAYGGALWAPADGPRTLLAIDTDSTSHSLGTTAGIRFDSPFDAADAWVTVEREGLLRQFRRPVRRGPNELSITASADMAPAALVGVVLVSRTAGASDSLHQRIRTGMARIRVDSMVKRLIVSIAPEQKEFAPGAEARMNLRVTDYRGRGTTAAVTVWAVDEGVLSMGGYSLPDPADALHAHVVRWMALASTLPSTFPVMDLRPSFIDLQTRDSLSSRSLLMRGAKSLALSEVVTTSVGYAAAGRELASSRLAYTTDVRKDFRTTAFFRGMALTDDAGRGTITVKLPDNITTYRLFAVAIGLDDRAGSAESTFVATHPLVVRAALPRFVRPGDTFLAGAAIGSRDGRPRDVRVEADAIGISLRGADSTSLRLGAGNAEARFAWTARESDSALVTLAATDGTNSDAVRVALPVKPDRFPLARAVSGVVHDSLTLRLTLPLDVDLARSRLTIRAGTTPLTVIDEALEYLAQYPYACTEQLLASARVFAASLTLQRAGLPVKPSRAFALKALQSTVDELVKRQRPDGAFGYWTSDSWSTPWLSAAVGLVLADAGDAGARIDDEVRDRLTNYLGRSLDSLPQMADTTSGNRLERRRTAATYLSERLAAATYLRRMRRPNETEERALLQRESLLAWEDRVLLAHQLHKAGKAPDAKRLLDRAWLAVGTAGLRVDLPDSIAGRGLFYSRVRPAARLVEATIAVDPSNPRLGALMERLVSRTTAVTRSPWNTQDYATAASAVVAFTRVVPRGEAVLTATLIAAQSETRVVALRTSDGAATDSTIALTALATRAGDSLVVRLRITARNGPIFYGVTSHEVSAVPDTRPVNNGVIVERWYERFDNGEPATEVREGELVRVRLRVTVPNARDFVAVEDPLPAGLEAVDLSLRTSGTLGPFETEESVESKARRDREAAAGGFLGSWDSGWWSPWEHSEKRDDRVTWFARALPTGTYAATYVARATTTGRFIRPPSRAEEMYNAATSGRSEGGIFIVTARQP